MWHRTSFLNIAIHARRGGPGAGGEALTFSFSSFRRFQALASPQPKTVAQRLPPSLGPRDAGVTSGHSSAPKRWPQKRLFQGPRTSSILFIICLLLFRGGRHGPQGGAALARPCPADTRHGGPTTSGEASPASYVPTAGGLPQSHRRSDVKGDKVPGAGEDRVRKGHPG